MQTPPPDAGLRLLVGDDDPTVAEAVAGRLGLGPAGYEVTRADAGLVAAPATRADDGPAAPATRADDGPAAAPATRVDDGPAAAPATRVDDGLVAAPATRADDGLVAAPACVARRRPGRPGHSTTTEG